MAVPYYGDFAEDATVRIPFNTFSSDDPQASSTITNLADSDLHVHKDGGTTQIATDGATVSIDYDTITGNHYAVIDTSAHADYSTGSEYAVRMEGTTVDGGTINAWIGSFSIERSGGALAYMKAGSVVAASVTGAVGSVTGAVGSVTGAVGSVTGAVGSVTAEVTADMTKISGDATAADNLELQYDTTGLTGDTFPATQSQISNIANVGSATHKPSSSYTLTTGTQSANTFAETEALDGVRHEHTDDTGVMELYYEFSIGAGVPSSCQITGYVTGGNDDLDVYGYDWVAAAWVQIGNIQGSGAANNAVNSFDMFVDMVGVGANSGTVRVRFYKASGLTTAVLAVDQIFVAFSQDAVSALDAVYFDSGAGNTGTTSIDGVPGNPVSTEAAVNTLLAARNLNKVQVALESSITFATTHADEIWIGPHWDLAQGGQDLSGSHFVGADVTGIATASVEKIDYLSCSFGTCTLPKMHAFSCGLTGTITFNEAGDYVFADCHSSIAGSSTPVIDTGAAIANVNLSMPNYQQGIEIRNLNNSGTDLFSISGIGQIIYAASSSGAVNQRGDWKVTNTGGVTITEDDNTSSITLIEADTNELQGDWTNGGRLDLILDARAAEATQISVADILTTQMTEAYAADGTAPTMAQALSLIMQSIGDFSISGTTLTVKKLDGSTTAATYTLDDSADPTSRTRAT